jgi:hypothetical protein
MFVFSPTPTFRDLLKRRFDERAASATSEPREPVVPPAKRMRAAKERVVPLALAKPAVEAEVEPQRLDVCDICHELDLQLDDGWAGDWEPASTAEFCSEVEFSASRAASVEIGFDYFDGFDASKVPLPYTDPATLEWPEFTLEERLTMTDVELAADREFNEFVYDHVFPSVWVDWEPGTPGSYVSLEGGVLREDSVSDFFADCD